MMMTADGGKPARNSRARGAGCTGWSTWPATAR